MLPKIKRATRVVYDNVRSRGGPHKFAVDNLCIDTVSEIFFLLCMHCHITKLPRWMQRKIIASTRADTQTPAYRTYDWKARPNPEQITPRPLPKHTPTINHQWLRVKG